MITLSAIVQAVIDRCVACLPDSLKGNVIRFPDKPAQFTELILKDKHRGEVLAVRHLKSAGEAGAEAVYIGISILATSSLREEKLAEAVRGYLNRYMVPGQSRLEFAADEPFEHDPGYPVRTVIYSIHRAAVPASDIAGLNAALNL